MFKQLVPIAYLVRCTQMAAADFGPSLALLVSVLVTGAWFLGVTADIADPATSFDTF